MSQTGTIEFQPPGRAGGLTMAGFGLTMFLSACLLFMVQPMFARMALPLLGGSSAVWAIAMCFFQGVLLAGYLYAHLLRIFAAPKLAFAIHAALLALAAASLPISPPQSAEALTGASSGLALMLLFGKAVALPFFALSATAPLLQSWFARTGHSHSANPYVLYAASNIGSIGALLVYPVAIEPWIGLTRQSATWALGFDGLAVAVLACGATQLWRPAPAARAQDTTAGPVKWKDRALWLLLSFIPSALLVAWTNHISADIASAPFIWLPPLILFLLTFVLVFRDTSALSMKTAGLMQLMGFPLTYAISAAASTTMVIVLLLAGALTFFGTTMICHRQLYESRPPASRLTEFYLVMSLGGVLGGLFVSIIAPLVFDGVSEFPLLLLAGLLVRREFWNLDLVKTLRAHAWPIAAIFGTCFVLMALARAYYWNGERTPLELSVFVVLPFIMQQLRQRAVAMATMATFALMNLFNLPAPLLEKRNYFGVQTVFELDGTTRRLKHGTTLHGAERLSDLASSARPAPLTYYTPRGGIARSLQIVQDRTRLAGTAVNAGIVGLGLGSMACYAHTGESWTMFEIDPNVIAIAGDPAQFTFMSRCGSESRIIEGDARISLRQWQDRPFDYLLIDAFTSDAIPAHLLTIEAMQTYVAHLAPGGVLAFHISNRHMRLEPFIVAAMHHAAPAARNRFIQFRKADRQSGESNSDVLVFSTDEELLAALSQDADVSTVAPVEDGMAWTDDLANIPAAILRKYQP